jgi:hypothetical protein
MCFPVCVRNKRIAMHRTRYAKPREILARCETWARKVMEHVRALMPYGSPEARRERVAREEAAQRLAEDIVCILRAIRRQRERLQDSREASGRAIGPS